MEPLDENKENKKSGVGVNGNLRPIVAGEVRNPRGRGIGTRNRSTIVKEWLEMASDGESNLDKVMRALILKASEGDVPAIKEVLDSGFGKLTDKSQVEMAATVQRIERTVVDPKASE